MKQSRLEGLADGIFAIVMTLLVIEIRVPDLVGEATNVALLDELNNIVPLFLSYALSFIVLFTYWRGHHYIASVLAKNIDNQLTNINALFLLFVALIPFSTHLLGTYNYSQVAIALYGINIVMIGVLLYWMRDYIHSAKTIKSGRWTERERRNGTVRILFPVFSALVAMLVSFWSTQISLALFTFAVIFNMSSVSTSMMDWCIKSVFRRPIRVISK